MTATGSTPSGNSAPEVLVTPDGIALVSRARRAWNTVADYAHRIWVNAGEDNIYFLAGGIAFNILLAALPFVFLVAGVLAWALNKSPADSAIEVRILLDRFLPPHPETATAPVHALLDGLLQVRTNITIYSAIGFAWFSTRLFGSLRTVIADVFDVEQERGIVRGKIFDLRITLIATFLLVVWLALSVYLAIATTRGVETLVNLGLRRDVMGSVEYLVGRVIAFAFIGAVFYALLRYLPNRPVSGMQAFVGAMTSAVLFEAARNLFTSVIMRFDPGSLYSGTFYALISVVFWVYYAALVFIVGAEVAQVYELRRLERLRLEGRIRAIS